MVTANAKFDRVEVIGPDGSRLQSLRAEALPAGSDDRRVWPPSGRLLSIELQRLDPNTLVCDRDRRLSD